MVCYTWISGFKLAKGWAQGKPSSVIIHLPYLSKYKSFFPTSDFKQWETVLSNSYQANVLVMSVFNFITCSWTVCCNLSKIVLMHSNNEFFQDVGTLYFSLLSVVPIS